MNCEEISELLPAYVLGALEPDEVEAVEAHLRAGHEHDAELIDLRATVFAMDRYADDQVVEPEAVTGPAVTPLRRQQTVRSAGLPRVWRAAAVAAVVVLLFGGGWVTGLLTSGNGSETYAYAIQGENGSFMEVSGVSSADSVTVVMAGFDRLNGSSYQVWAIRDGVWVSIGVCNTNSEGGWVGDFNFSLQGGEEVALTIEPAGGSPSPTSAPLLRSAHWPSDE